MKINNRSIGVNYGPYIIAEIGINHDGSLDRAIKMIEAAKDSGANAVKFQMYKADEIFIEKSQIGAAAYYQFSLSQWRDLRQYVNRLNLDFILTVFGFDSLKMSQQLGYSVDAYKIGSGENNWFEFIDKVLEYNIPTIISLGNREKNEKVQIIKKYENNNVAFLHCRSEYPAPPESLELNTVDHLSRCLINCPIGYSDHTPSILSSLIAIVHGATIIEKHFVLEDRQGIDANVSITPKQLKDLVKLSKQIHKMNKINYKLIPHNPAFGRGLYYASNLPTGHVITENDIMVKRPANGLDINSKNHWVGKVLKKDVVYSESLKTHDI